MTNDYRGRKAPFSCLALLLLVCHTYCISRRRHNLNITMTAIHTLTNGTQNFIFEADEEETTIWTINVFGGLDKTETFTTAVAREHWAFALKCGCTKGWTTSPYREQPSAFDDNRWEEELALAQA